MKYFAIKYLLFFSILFNCQTLLSQQINGVYEGDFTIFRNYVDPKNNFNKNYDYIIVVEIYDEPFTRGYVSVISSNDGIIVPLKFIIKGNKSYTYEDGQTFLVYDAVVSLMEVETSTKCKIAFNVNLETFTVLYSNESVQLWNLKEKKY